MATAQALTFSESPPVLNMEKIRSLNDTFRRNIFNLPTLGEVILTSGVSALSDTDRFALVDEVRCFEDFVHDNDPYGEHDFGKITYHNEDYFFKIDYYDTNLEYHSPDKSNPNQTRRVLTIMRADEY